MFKKSYFSQNGEDGIIEKILSIIGDGNKKFCEVGASNGINLSNTRRLTEKGWEGLLIECDKTKFKDLERNYKRYPKIKCIQKYIDNKSNNINDICKKYGFSNLDFLSIDIDGLDFEILESLKIRPRMICIEVNAGHYYDSNDKIPLSVAKNNVGQPLKLFSAKAKKMGYGLLCYTGNAFYTQKDIVKKYNLKILSDRIAYTNFIDSLSDKECEWLYLVNLGLVYPYYFYRNRSLSGNDLNIPLKRRIRLIAEQTVSVNFVNVLKAHFLRLLIKQ